MLRIPDWTDDQWNEAARGPRPGVTPGTKIKEALTKLADGYPSSMGQVEIRSEHLPASAEAQAKGCHGVDVYSIGFGSILSMVINAEFCESDGAYSIAISITAYIAGYKVLDQEVFKLTAQNKSLTFKPSILFGQVYAELTIGIRGQDICLYVKGKACAFGACTEEFDETLGCYLSNLSINATPTE